VLRARMCGAIPLLSGEIYNLHNDLNITKDTEIGRLGQVGHIISTEDARIPYKVLNGKFFNTRPVGKPRTRWKDVIWKDTSQILRIR
jgi:hypothetical protein